MTSTITSTIKDLKATYGPQAQTVVHQTLTSYNAHLVVFEIVSVILTALFVTLIVVILIKTGWVQTRLHRVDDVILKADRTKKFVKKSWGEVERHFFSGSDNDLKIAVIKADTLLNRALREAGVHGQDLGERLASLTPNELPNIEHVWEAHKLRNRIAHEPSFALKRDLAERALTVYEKALEHLGILEKISDTDTGSAPTEPQNHSPKSP